MEEKEKSLTETLIEITEKALEDETKVEIGKIIYTAMGLLMHMDKGTEAFDMLKEKLTVSEYDRFMSNLTQSFIVTLYATRFDSPDDPDFIRLRDKLRNANGASVTEFIKTAEGRFKA